MAKAEEVEIATGSVDAVREEPLRERLSKRFVISIAGLYLAGALVLTFPLGLHLASSTPADFGDSRLTTYVLAWDAHALAHYPTRLFQDPIFYPAPDALAYTDHSVGLALFAAPIDWTTGNPYLAQNIVLILSIAFSGLTAALLAFELVQDRRAAIVAGAAYAFCPYWFGHVINIAHIQILASGWMPLCFLGIHRWLRTQSPRWVALAGSAFVMAALTSWYQAIYLTLAVVAFTVVLAVLSRPKRLMSILLQGAIATVLVGGILLPFALPYHRIQQRDPNFVRTEAQAGPYSAVYSSYLSAPKNNVLWATTTASFRRNQRGLAGLERTLFPGAACLVLALVGLLSFRHFRRDGPVLTATLAFTVIAVLISFGPHAVAGTSLWKFLFEHLSFLHALRVPARVEIITLVGLSVMAAFGARSLLRWFPRFATLLCILLTAAIFAEGLSIPIGLGKAVRVPSVYASLAHRPGAILELPTGKPSLRNWAGPSNFDIEYMLYQTKHWRPIANGYSGYRPSYYDHTLAIALALPSKSALIALRQLGIDTLILHTDLVVATPWKELQSELRLVRDVSILSVSGPIIVYSLDRVPVS